MAEARFIYRCAECGDTAPIHAGPVTVVTEMPPACRNGHRDSWTVEPERTLTAAQVAEISAAVDEYERNTTTDPT